MLKLTLLLRCVALALSIVPQVWSQEPRATIVGRVTDSTGLAVVQAQVWITNTATGVVIPVETNDAGNYSALYLTPSTYEVKVEKDGFKRFVRSGLELRINDRVEINISLELGQVSETVSVTAETPLLETASASVGQVVDARRVAELPTPHGNPILLLRLNSNTNMAAPHARFDTPWEPQFTGNFAMAGSRGYRAEFSLDGATNTNTEMAASGRGAVSPAYTPPADAVAEFKVQTVVFDATLGQTEGGVVNTSLKSGTNTIHGTLYYAKQDPSLNANLFFSNRIGQPRADFNYHRWGGTFSGPVVLPKLYDGRNKTFFMFAHEGIRQKSVQGTTTTVPTAAQRQGDFSSLLRLGSIYQIYDPMTRTAAAGGRFQSQPLPGNIIPASRISPIAKNILNYYPQPSVAGTSDGGNNLPLENWPQRISYHTELYRFDHNFSVNNRMFVRVNNWTRTSIGSDWFGLDNPALGAYFIQDQAGFTIDDVHVFSPTMVMNWKISETRFVRAQDATDPGINFDVTSLGLPAYLRDAQADAYRRFPSVLIGGYTSLGPRTPLHRPAEVRQGLVAFDKISGQHTVKFGGEYRAYLENQRAGTVTTSSQLSFSDAYTRGPLDTSAAAPRGQALASMMMGVLSGGGFLVPADYAEKSSVWAGFLQDDWKVNRKLTVTLGLRYELEGPLSERYNRTVRGFDPSVVLPISARAEANYAASPTPEVPASQFRVRGGLQFAGVDGQPRTVFDRDTNNFMPRIGAALSITPKTVLRAGYGIYFGALGARRGDVVQNGFERLTPVEPSFDGGLTFNATLANPFPSGLQQPAGAGLGAMTDVGRAISYFNTQPQAARSQKWMFGVQRVLPGSFVLEMRYMGSRGSDIEYDRALNALPNEYLSTSPTRDQPTINYLNANLSNPFRDLLPGTGRSSNVIPRAVLLSPYPQYTNISSTFFGGTSWYNSINFDLQKRFSAGYTVQLSYSWSKFIEAVSLLNAGDQQLERVISPQDYPHHLAVSWVYELPFGRTRKFFSTWKKVPEALFGGWQVSGIYTYQSGGAIGFGDAILFGSIKEIPLPAEERSVSRWFDTSVFERNPANQHVRHLRTMSSQFSGIRGDHFNYWDLSLMKNTNLTEKVRLEIRAEALNAMNTPSFTSPNTVPSNTAFGTITQEKVIPRRVQLTLRVKF